MMALTEESSPNLRSLGVDLVGVEDDAVDVDDGDLAAAEFEGGSLRWSSAARARSWPRMSKRR